MNGLGRQLIDLSTARRPDLVNAVAEGVTGHLCLTLSHSCRLGWCRCTDIDRTEQ